MSGGRSIEIYIINNFFKFNLVDLIGLLYL